MGSETRIALQKESGGGGKPDGYESSGSESGENKPSVTRSHGKSSLQMHKHKMSTDSIRIMTPRGSFNEVAQVEQSSSQQQGKLPQHRHGNAAVFSESNSIAGTPAGLLQHVNRNKQFKEDQPQEQSNVQPKSLRGSQREIAIPVKGVQLSEFNQAVQLRLTQTQNGGMNAVHKNSYDEEFAKVNKRDLQSGTAAATTAAGLKTGATLSAGTNATAPQRILTTKLTRKATTQSKQNNRNQKGGLMILMEKLNEYCSSFWMNCKRRWQRKKKNQSSKSNDASNSAATSGLATVLKKRPTNDAQNINTLSSGKQGAATDSSNDEEINLQFRTGTATGTTHQQQSQSPKSKSEQLRSKLRQAKAAIPKEQSKESKELDELEEVIKQIGSHSKLMEKAYRHLMDGLLYRTVRNDLDLENGDLSKFVLFVWRVQNSSLWNDFLLFLGWVYILMSFFEPSNRNDSSLDYDTFIVMVGIEAMILGLQTFDLIMEVVSRATKKKKRVLQAVFTHKKNFFRLLFFLLNLSDLLWYVTKYPANTFRFARVIRPLQIIIFSKSLRRNFQGIVNSAKNLLMILFFDLIISFFWAYIGVNMIGDLYEDPTVDTLSIDFRDFFKGANALYIFSTLDLYPDILYPAVQSSLGYLAYFLPYIVMFLLLFAPIPVAVVYEGFRKHRLNLLIADRIKRRKALWACFKCIVKDKKSYIGRRDFVEFFKFVYLKVEFDEEAELIAEVLWQELDMNENLKVNIQEFFNVIDITEQRSEFRLQRFKPFKWWVDFRQAVAMKIDLHAFIVSEKFQMFSHLITLGSCSFTLMGLFLDDTSDTIYYTDIIDHGFFAFFCFEIILKVIAYGPSEFGEDSWNMFDLTLVLFSAFFDYIFYEFLKGTNINALSASRVLKIAKLQKIFRMFRALRTVKILRFIFSGLDIIHKVYEMLYKIVICIPIVMRLSVICVIVFYIYAAIGVEVFADNLFQSEYASPYAACPPLTTETDSTKCEFANFSTFGGAVLILLQICVGAGWGYVQFDYGRKFNDFTLSVIYFNSFHFISVFVLSLIGGLVWEVFDVVERIMRDQQAYEQQMELQQQWEEQQMLLEGSFQSGLGSSFNHNQNHGGSSGPDGIKKSLGTPSTIHGLGSGVRKHLRPSVMGASAMMKLPMKSQKMMGSMTYHPAQDEQGQYEDEDDDFDEEDEEIDYDLEGVGHAIKEHLNGLPVPPQLKFNSKSTIQKSKSKKENKRDSISGIPGLKSKRVSINIAAEQAFLFNANHDSFEEQQQQLASDAQSPMDSVDSSESSDDEDFDESDFEDVDDDSLEEVDDNGSESEVVEEDGVDKGDGSSKEGVMRKSKQVDNKIPSLVFLSKGDMNVSEESKQKQKSNSGLFESKKQQRDNSEKKQVDGVTQTQQVSQGSLNAIPSNAWLKMKNGKGAGTEYGTAQNSERISQSQLQSPEIGDSQQQGYSGVGGNALMMEQSSKQNKKKFGSSSSFSGSGSKIKKNSKTRLQGMTSSASSKSSLKQKQAKKKKKKQLKEIAKKNGEMEQKCIVDGAMVSQRDRGQLILYQDLFKMSTLDAFFAKRELPSSEQLKVSQQEFMQKLIHAQKQSQQQYQLWVSHFQQQSMQLDQSLQSFSFIEQVPGTTSSQQQQQQSSHQSSLNQLNPLGQVGLIGKSFSTPAATAGSTSVNAMKAMFASAGNVGQTGSITNASGNSSAHHIFNSNQLPQLIGGISSIQQTQFHVINEEEEEEYEQNRSNLSHSVLPRQVPAVSSGGVRNSTQLSDSAAIVGSGGVNNGNVRDSIGSWDLHQLDTLQSPQNSQSQQQQKYQQQIINFETGGATAGEYSSSRSNFIFQTIGETEEANYVESNRVILPQEGDRVVTMTANTAHNQPYQTAKKPLPFPPSSSIHNKKSNSETSPKNHQTNIIPSWNNSNDAARTQAGHNQQEIQQIPLDLFSRPSSKKNSLDYSQIDEVIQYPLRGAGAVVEAAEEARNDGLAAKKSEFQGERHSNNSGGPQSSPRLLQGMTSVTSENVISTTSIAQHQALQQQQQQMQQQHAHHVPQQQSQQVNRVELNSSILRHVNESQSAFLQNGHSVASSLVSEMNILGVQQDDSSKKSIHTELNDVLLLGSQNSTVTVNAALQFSPDLGIQSRNKLEEQPLIAQSQQHYPLSRYLPSNKNLREERNRIRKKELIQLKSLGSSDAINSSNAPLNLASEKEDSDFMGISPISRKKSVTEVTEQQTQKRGAKTPQIITNFSENKSSNLGNIHGDVQSPFSAGVRQPTTEYDESSPSAFALAEQKVKQQIKKTKSLYVSNNINYNNSESSPQSDQNIPFNQQKPMLKQQQQQLLQQQQSGSSIRIDEIFLTEHEDILLPPIPFNDSKFKRVVDENNQVKLENEDYNNAILMRKRSNEENNDDQMKTHPVDVSLTSFHQLHDHPHQSIFSERDNLGVFSQQQKYHKEEDNLFADELNSYKVMTHNNNAIEATFPNIMPEIPKQGEEQEEDLKKLKIQQRRLDRREAKQIAREKGRKDIENYYTQNLLDVELSNGRLSEKTVQQQQNSNPLMFAASAAMQKSNKQFSGLFSRVGSANGIDGNAASHIHHNPHEQAQQSIDTAPSNATNSEFKSIERELIQDQPDNKKLLNQIVNVNSDLRHKQGFQLKIDLGNMNYIINKAILKSVNQEKIHNIELRHFKQIYGSHFEDLLDDYIFPLWNHQAKILFHLGNAFKYDNIPVERFVQLFTSLEMQISALLMNKFSSFKIMFQDSDRTWFTINFVQESYLLQEVDAGGPWEFFDSLFGTQSQSSLQPHIQTSSGPRDMRRLWKHRNIYQISDQPGYVRRSVKRFFRVSQEISNNFSFHKLQMNQKRSDVIYIPLINDAPQIIQQKALDLLEGARKSSSTLPPEYITKDDMRIERIPLILKALVVVHLFDNPIMKDRKRTFESNHINIEQAIVEDDMLEQQAQQQTLNYTYSIEFLKDIKNALLIHKDSLFTKVTQFYFHRACFERNFSNMSKVPFE